MSRLRSELRRGKMRDELFGEGLEAGSLRRGREGGRGLGMSRLPDCAR